MPPLVPLALVARGSFVKISRAARSIRRFGESRYSVMTTTVAEAIKWAILRKLRVVNLSAGTDVSKTRWRPHVVTTCSGVLLAPHRSARLKWHLAKRVEENGREGAWLSRVVKLARRRG